MTAPAIHTVSCSDCGRTYNLSLSALARRRTCTFCGAPLKLSADVEAQLRNQATMNASVSGSTGHKPTGKIPVECPLCLRRAFADRANPKQRTYCQFCTCPFTVNDSGRAVPDAPALAVPASVSAILARIKCPSCKHLGVALRGGTGIKCPACGADVNLSSVPLQNLIDLSSHSDSDALSEVGREALRARWSRRELGLAEAEYLAVELRRADATVAADAGDLLTRASMNVTIDVVQYVILCAPHAIRQPTENGVSLTVVVGKGAADDRSGLALGKTLAFNAVGIGLLAVTGVGFTGYVEDRDVRTDPAFILEFAQTMDGTTLHILQRLPDGSIIPADASVEGQVFSKVQNGMPDGLRRYYLFKAIYGYWLNGQMLYGTPGTALRKRLEQLGGVLASKSELLAKALVPAGEQLPG